MGLSLLPIVILILELVFSWSEKVSTSLKRFKTETVYWNLYLRYLMEVFLELALSSLIRIQSFDFKTVADSVLTFYAMILLLILVFYAVQTALFLRKNHANIRLQNFKNKYGALVQGLQYREKTAMFYPTVFMVRRGIFALTIVYLSKLNVFQI